jgi:hypothetical protein
MELTTNLLKVGVSLHYNLVNLLELVFPNFRFFSLEEIQLIELLLRHYKILSGNYCEILFIWALLYSQNLIWLSFSALQKTDWNLV